MTIAGTRITLYDVMDYVTERYPPKFIRAMLSLMDEQVNAALFYIEIYRPEVEAEYQLVLKEADTLRQYYVTTRYGRKCQLSTAAYAR